MSGVGEKKAQVGKNESWGEESAGWRSRADLDSELGLILGMKEPGRPHRRPGSAPSMVHEGG